MLCKTEVSTKVTTAKYNTEPCPPREAHASGSTSLLDRLSATFSQRRCLEHMLLNSTSPCFRLLTTLSQLLPPLPQLLLGSTSLTPASRRFFRDDFRSDSSAAPAWSTPWELMLAQNLEQLDISHGNVEYLRRHRINPRHVFVIAGPRSVSRHGPASRARACFVALGHLPTMVSQRRLELVHHASCRFLQFSPPSFPSPRAQSSFSYSVLSASLEASRSVPSSQTSISHCRLATHQRATCTFLLLLHETARQASSFMPALLLVLLSALHNLQARRRLKLLPRLVRLDKKVQVV